ncbi:DDE-type integrase/transposase/recombinase [Mycolicibacterium austroafricanum]|nr:DDE-type integrase/transposase/recombinase [Mycolicibacterium austroafricanum]QZT69986.1 DDE-type integrase/transposase/recombinase [Mycolicibacterium austroafricanum]
MTGNAGSSSSPASPTTAGWQIPSPTPKSSRLDITGHRTDEGKLYLCAIVDAFSNRIVGYSIDSRMKSWLATRALHSAVARRGEVARGAFRTRIGNHSSGQDDSCWR